MGIATLLLSNLDYYVLINNNNMKNIKMSMDLTVITELVKQLVGRVP